MIPQATRDLFYSIIMPAYNEEAVLDATVRDLCGYLDGTRHRYELLVVDDASTDSTRAVANALSAEFPALRVLRNSGSNGYGHAIRCGLNAYCGDAAVVVTSDGADAPKDVAAYFDAIAQGYDCAFGSRFGPDSRVEGYPPVKRVINRMANRLIGWLVGSRYRDFTNGFKCYRREVIDRMGPFVSGQFNITIEMSLKAVLDGARIMVVPNDWRQRDAGQSSFKVLSLIRPYGATLLYCLCRAYLTNPIRNPSRDGGKAPAADTVVQMPPRSATRR